MEIANFVVTLISIVVTVIGIAFSYYAMISAKDASMNSKKALELVDNFDVFAFVSNQIYSKLNLSKLEIETLTRDVEGVRSALKKLSNVQDNKLYLSTIDKNCSSISKVMNSYLQKIKVKTLNDE